MANLPVVIFQFALSPYKDWQQLAWSGALLITLAILLLSIVGARHRVRRMNRRGNSDERPFAAAFERSAPVAAARRVKFDVRNLDFFYGRARR